MKPTRPCSKPGCPELVTSTSRCPAHTPPRPTAAFRGYDSAWQRLRARYLTNHYVCMVDQCYARASDVDHILPRALGGTDDQRNLQALCSMHHKRKTALQSSHWGQGYENR
jgi:5-methylcytosine-specific restriction protein A